MRLSMKQTTLALLLSLGLVAGCSTTGETPDGQQDSDVSAVDQDGGTTVYGGDDDGGISASEMSERERREAEARAQAEEQQALLRITTFYFDFDTAEIKQEARDVLIAHAGYLAGNPDVSVRLEGHTDERGTKEYNLALGERRAMAVERFLVVNGASRDQIETVSFGEEKPAASGSSESAWAQNRRVELKFL